MCTIPGTRRREPPAGRSVACKVRYGRRGSPPRRTLALLSAGLLLLFPGGIANAGSAGAGTARLRVQARILPRSEARILMQPSTFRVTERDVQRGYVEIPGETPLEVRSNGRGTHLLVFDGILAEPGLLRGAEVRGLGRQARIDPPGGWIPIPTERGRATFRLEWRFLLGEGARPGTYPWPYRLSARPL